MPFDDAALADAEDAAAVDLDDAPADEADLVDADLEEEAAEEVDLVEADSVEGNLDEAAAEDASEDAAAADAAAPEDASEVEAVTDEADVFEVAPEDDASDADAPEDAVPDDASAEGEADAPAAESPCSEDPCVGSAGELTNCAAPLVVLLEEGCTAAPGIDVVAAWGITASAMPAAQASVAHVATVARAAVRDSARLRRGCWASPSALGERLDCHQARSAPERMGVSTKRNERSDSANMTMICETRTHQGASIVDVKRDVARMMG